MTADQIPPLTALLGAIASLSWPVLAIVALLIFRGPVLRALQRVAEDGGTVEVFGVKVNVGKATEEQQGLIEDLQKQVQTLREAIGVAAIPAAPVAAAVSPPDRPRRASPRILWVDDVPDNNAVLVASLRNRGFEIEQSLSTDDAVAQFDEGAFDIVISDMGRGADRSAGLTLARILRGRDSQVPLLIFCSNKAAAVYREEALAAGVDVITDSATILMEALLKLKAPQ